MAENDITSILKANNDLAWFDKAREDTYQSMLKNAQELSRTNKQAAKDARELAAEYKKSTDLIRQQIIDSKAKSDLEKMSIADRITYNQQVSKSISQEIAEKQAMLEVTQNLNEQIKLRNDINQLTENKNALDQNTLRIQKAINEVEFKNASIKEKVNLLKAKEQEALKKYKAAANEIDTKVKLGKISKEEGEAEKQQAKKDSGIGESADLLSGALSDMLGDGVGQFITPLIDGISEAIPGGQIVSVLMDVIGVINKVSGQIDKAIDNAMDILTSYLGKIDGRLQGTDESYLEIAKTIRLNFSSNTYVSQTKMLENISALVESGIAYNLEERALLMSVSDKIVETFDVLDATLTRLTRLQQGDMTQAFMGVEARLLQDLNSLFTDSSYLNDMYDSVSSAIIDAASQKNLSDATAFSYQVQKWLGALYSTGMSSEGVSQIAQGLNYLSTGNVSALSSNSALQTLLALSAKNAGISYAEILTNGLDADTTNKLMRSMVEYLQDIVKNTSNQVTKSAWGGITNFSMSDLRAIQNISTATINQLYNKNMNYTTAIDELNSQLSNISSRYSIQEKINNAIDNFMFSTGSDIANDNFKYLAWKGSKILQDQLSMGGIGTILGGLIQIPLGFGTILSNLISGSVLSDVWNGLTGKSTLDSVLDWSKYMSSFNSRTLDKDSLFKTLIDSTLSNNNGTTSSSGTIMIGNTSTVQGNTIPEYSFGYENQNKSLTATSIMNDTSGVIRDIGDVYFKLFEDQSTPLNVKIEYLEDKALDQLEEKLHTKFVEFIYNQLAYESISVHETGASGNGIQNKLSETQR